jgi:hypothetical protein
MNNLTALTGSDSSVVDIIPVLIVLVIPLGYMWSKYKLKHKKRAWA